MKVCAGLEWVALDDRRVHVSDFAHLPPGNRPTVACPECRDRVILALGPVIRHHARHRKGVACLAAHPETALHFNTKYYLADVLTLAAGKGVPLRIQRRCLVGNRSYETHGDVTWVESTSESCTGCDEPILVGDWDEVHVEARLGDQARHRIPDIVLLKDGRPVAAIEVFATHEVEPAKAEMFARLEVPWVEVRATDELCDRSAGWRIDQPLMPHASSVALAWRCEAHEIQRSRERSRRVVVAERPPERPSLDDGKIVDLYYADGTSRRAVYRIRAAYADGKLIRLALDRDGQLIDRYPVVDGETEYAFRARVRKVIGRDCNENIAAISRNATLVDVSRWLKSNALGLIDSGMRVRRRYRFNHAARVWEPDTATDEALRLRAIESAIPKVRHVIQRSLKPK